MNILQRIEELEKKVAELEGRLGPPAKESKDDKCEHEWHYGLNSVQYCRLCGVPAIANKPTPPKEESLAEKFVKEWYDYKQVRNMFSTTEEKAEHISKIATTHFQDRFERAVRDLGIETDEANHIRERLFGKEGA